MYQPLFSRKRAAAFLSIILAACLSGHASPLAFDNFESYTVGQDIIGESGGIGWNSAWTGNPSNTPSTQAIVSTHSITYSFGGHTIGGGKSLRFDANASFPVLSRDVFASVDKSGQDYYISFIFQSESATANNAAFVSWHAKDEADVFNEGNMGVINANTIRARVDTTDTNVTDAAVTNADVHFMIVRFSGWDDTAYRNTTVWFNPGPGDQNTTDPTIVATAIKLDGGATGFGGISVRATSFNSERAMYFDDVRVGTSWDSVTPVPEPQTAVLVLAAAVGLLALLRRRNTRS